MVTIYDGRGTDGNHRERAMKKESWKRNHGGIRKGEPWRMHHGGIIMEEATGGDSQEEALRRRQPGVTRRHPDGPRSVSVSVTVSVQILLHLLGWEPRNYTPHRSGEFSQFSNKLI